MKGFRDVIAEAEALGDATAQGAKTAREATPRRRRPAKPSSTASNRAIEPEGLRAPRRAPVRPAEQLRRRAARAETPAAAAPRRDGRPSRRRLRRRSRSAIEPRPAAAARKARCGSLRPTISANCRKRSRAGLIAAHPRGAAHRRRSAPPPIGSATASPGCWMPCAAAQRAAGAEGCRRRAEAEDPDRVGQPAAPAGRRPAAGAIRPPAPIAAVAQRVVLYEEDPADPQGKRYRRLGDLAHRDRVAGPGRPPDLAVRADHRDSRAPHHHDDSRSGATSTRRCPRAIPSRSRSTCRRISRSAGSRTCPAS